MQLLSYSSTGNSVAIECRDGESQHECLSRFLFEQQPPVVRQESPQPMPAATSPVAGSGPGTNLKAFFLKWFGQKATPNCSCNAVAARMDTMGPQWCRDNMDWILDQIRLNAERRKLPFIRAVVEPIVLLAIRKAERAAKSGQ